MNRIINEKDLDWNQNYVMDTVLKIMKRRGTKAGLELKTLRKAFGELKFFKKCKEMLDEKRYHDLINKLSYLNVKNLNTVIEYGKWIM